MSSSVTFPWPDGNSVQWKTGDILVKCAATGAFCIDYLLIFAIRQTPHGHLAVIIYQC